MRKLLSIAALLTVFYAAAGLAIAQPTPNTGPSVQIFSDGSCPLQMSVRFLTTQQLRNAGDHDSDGPAGLIVILDLQNGFPRDVTSLEAHVRAFSGAVQMRLTEDGTLYSPKHRPPEFTVPFDWEKRLPANQKSEVKWRLKDATSIEWVQLDKVKYADGRVWVRADGGGCRVAPDSLLRIAAR